MMKGKYYRRKAKSEITKDIFYWLLTAGAVVIAATSPFFIVNIMKGFKKGKKYKKQNLNNAFYRLKKAGYIEIQKSNHQIYMALTKEGQKKAGWFRINDLQVKRPEKWDKKWRIVIFDISHLKRFYREVFRGKLKELGFLPLQKSVWIYPFDCKYEIDILRDFLGLKEKEIRLITASEIGNDDWLIAKFKLSGENIKL